MATKLKLPLKQAQEEIYPLTTLDQVIRPDNEERMFANDKINLTTTDITGLDEKIQDILSQLGGVFHYQGPVNAMPPEENTYVAGDVVSYGSKEYVKLENGNWLELGDETGYAIKGAIKDSDIAEDANIAQEKISGLTDIADKLTQVIAAIQSETLFESDDEGNLYYNVPEIQ